MDQFKHQELGPSGIDRGAEVQSAGVWLGHPNSPAARA